MEFHTRKLIKPGDLNGNNTLFGGQLLRWIDEEAFIYAVSKLENHHIVTKYMSEINFVSSAKRGDIVEIGLQFIAVGRTSITLHCVVRNIISKKVIIEIDKMVFVNLGADAKPAPHGKTLKNLSLNNDKN